MPYSNPIPQRVAIIGHPSLEGAMALAGEIDAHLSAQGLVSAHGSVYNEGLRQRVAAGEFDLLIALGGDGTLLKAGHLAAPQGVPVLGINMGHFGFLYEVQRHEWQSVLSLLLKGDYWLEKRMMLRAEHWHLDDKAGPWEVVNDVVVARGQVVRPVQLSAYVDGIFLASFVADGLIVSTATGSTAYALAAGGPILPPELRNILIMPVAPHLSIDRAVILPEGASVSVTVSTPHEAVLSVDGQPSIPMADGDKVLVTASTHTLLFMRFQDPGYFYRNLTAYMEQNPLTGNSR